MAKEFGLWTGDFLNMRLSFISFLYSLAELLLGPRLHFTCWGEIMAKGRHVPPLKNFPVASGETDHYNTVIIVV